MEFCVYCLLAVTVNSAVIASGPAAGQSGRKWNGNTVRLLISGSLRQQSIAIKTGTDVDAAVMAAASPWESSAGVEISFADSTLESVSNSRSGGDGTSLVTVAATSENLTLFPEQENSAPAYTRLFYDRRGAIIEADVVLNPYIQFSSDETPGTYDLQSVLTHEFGHVLGLRHSPVVSATMYGRLSPNRERSMKGIEARTLAASDISAVRAIYGPGGSGVDCCSAIFGTLSGPIGPTGVVWVEEADSGRLVAADEYGNGSFNLAGFAPGKYRLLAQGARQRGAAQIFEKDLDLPVSVRKTLAAPTTDAEIKLIGTNGELGILSVSLTKGNSQQIFIGGTGMDLSKVIFGTSSRHLSIAAGGTFPMNFSGGVTAAALTILVDADTPPGEYSIFVETANGSRKYLLGGISVD